MLLYVINVVVYYITCILNVTVGYQRVYPQSKGLEEQGMGEESNRKTKIIFYVFVCC